MTIYLVEDDADIREMERYALQNSGFQVREFADGAQFLAAMEPNSCGLVILDIMLPGLDGLTVLQKLRERQETREVPVILVTAKTTELDKVKGLNLGADDYLCKPFGIMELVARVRALLRRSIGVQQETPPVLECAGIVMDDARHNVTALGRECVLTYKEYELLKLLMLHKNRVLTREQIMDRVWDMSYESESRTVDMHIKTLRQKLGEAGCAIRTVRNVGYQLEAQYDR